MVGGNADDGSLSLQEKVIREQLQILDTLHGEIKWRSSHMIDINAKFGFLTMMERHLVSFRHCVSSLTLVKCWKFWWSMRCY